MFEALYWIFTMCLIGATIYGFAAWMQRLILSWPKQGRYSIAAETHVEAVQSRRGSRLRRGTISYLASRTKPDYPGCA